MPTKTDPALIASQLRLVMGRLVRRLRVEHRVPLSHLAVVGRLDREGAQSVSDLATSERMRPQSMAQAVSDLELAGMVSRTPDPGDRRRALVALTEQGRAMLETDRRRREGWLAEAIENDLHPDEQALLAEAVELMRRIADGA